jgi:CAAX protease family protein
MPPSSAHERRAAAGITGFVARHPVSSYFALTFAISWGGVLVVITRPAATPGVNAQDHPLFPVAVLAMLAGPSVAGIVSTALVDGRAGLRQVLSRLATWRVAARWYGVALLTAPLLAIAVSLALSTTSPEFFPAVLVTSDAGRVVVLGLVVGLAAGFFEELGWTGFAIPQLLPRHGVCATGLLVGALWSGWHALVVAWGIGDRAGTVPLALFMIVDGLATLPAFRVLIVAVYARTQSLLLIVLMHASLTASALILTPRTTGVPLVVYGWVFAAAVWLVVAAIGRTADHDGLERRADQPRAPAADRPCRALASRRPA